MPYDPRGRRRDRPPRPDPRGARSPSWTTGCSASASAYRARSTRRRPASSTRRPCPGRPLPVGPVLRAAHRHAGPGRQRREHAGRGRAVVRDRAASTRRTWWSRSGAASAAGSSSTAASTAARTAAPARSATSRSTAAGRNRPAPADRPAAWRRTSVPPALVRTRPRAPAHRPARQPVHLVACGNDRRRRRARQVFEDAGELLGRALAGVIHTVDPEVVVLMGEGVDGWEFWETGFEPSFRRSSAARPPQPCRCVVEPWTEDQWARGAASLVLASPFDSAGNGGEQSRLVRAGRAPMSRPRHECHCDEPRAELEEPRLGAVLPAAQRDPAVASSPLVPMVSSALGEPAQVEPDLADGVGRARQLHATCSPTRRPAASSCTR